MSEDKAAPGLIYSLMPKLMGQIGEIAKGHKNSAMGYAYRSIEDVLARCQRVFIDNGITVSPNIRNEAIEGGVFRYVLDVMFVAPDGSYITGSTLVFGKLSNSGVQQSGAAYSYAFKEVIFKTFVVPVQQEDGDRDEGQDDSYSNTTSTTNSAKNTDGQSSSKKPKKKAPSKKAPKKASPASEAGTTPPDYETMNIEELRGEALKAAESGDEELFQRLVEIGKRRMATPANA